MFPRRAPRGAMLGMLVKLLDARREVRGVLSERSLRETRVLQVTDRDEAGRHVDAARREAARYQSELFKLAREGSSSSSSPAPDVFAEARAALYDDAAAPEENLRSCVAFIAHMRKLLRLESNRTRRRRLSGHGRRLFAQQFSASNLLTDSSSGDDGDDDDIGDEDIGDGDGGDDDRKK